MTGKNITKRKKVFAFVCIVIFFGEAILFVLNAATDYKTYTDSKVVKAEVINVSGTKNGMLDAFYRTSGTHQKAPSVSGHLRLFFCTPYHFFLHISKNPSSSAGVTVCATFVIYFAYTPMIESP